MEQEGTFDFQEGGATRVVDRSDYIEVEDNGSDVTIFSLAGMAVLFAGLPRYEFRRLLKENGNKYNLVFVRDTARAMYTKAPDGSDRGIAFFEDAIMEVIEQLGSKYNIALGASGGGAGAFFLCHRVPFNQIIAFSPAFPVDVYLAKGAMLRTFFDFKKLLTEPTAYFEVVLVTLGALHVFRTLRRRLGDRPVPDLLEIYLDAYPKPPRASIFFGERCRPDREQATRLGHVPSITLRPVDSGRHNCAADLKKRGQLGTAILAEVEAGVAEWRAEQVAPQS